jgi:hypothetical protein
MKKIVQCGLFSVIAVLLFANVVSALGAGASGLQMGALGWFIFFAEFALSFVALLAAFGSFIKHRGFRILSVVAAVLCVVFFSYAIGYVALASRTSGFALSANPYLWMITSPFLISIAAAALSIRDLQHETR